jgi:hypothetical protein
MRSTFDEECSCLGFPAGLSAGELSRVPRCRGRVRKLSAADRHIRFADETLSRIILAGELAGRM